MDFTKDIAALESLFAQETNNYHTTANLQGKPWYGVGLEDIDSNTQKDDTNKRGVVRRMIDAVISFISNILKKIKEFFQGKPKKVDAEKVFNEYKGPADADVVDALKGFANDINKTTEHTSEMMEKMRKSNEEHKATREKDPKAQKEHDRTVADLEKKGAEFAATAAKVTKMVDEQKKINDILNGIYKGTGTALDADEVMTAITEQITDSFFDNHRYQTTTWFVMTLSDEFSNLYDSAVTAFHDMTGKQDFADKELSDKLSKAVTACRNLQGDKRLTPKEELLPVIKKVVSGDTNIREYSKHYLTDAKLLAKETEKVYDAMRVKLTGLKSSGGDNDQAAVQAYQKAAAAIGMFAMLLRTVSDWSHACAELLIKD